jgi:transcription termination/antitermination protein NusA
MTAGPSFPLGGELHARSSDTPSLGVEDALRDIAGVATPMLAAFGANGIRTVEDLAACATDDLIGWTEQRGAEVTRHPGILGDLMMSRQECDALILRARVRAGWIEAA